MTDQEKTRGELLTAPAELGRFSSRGRPKTEEVAPELAPQIRALVEPLSQADPKFQTPLAFTRLTAKAVHQHLKADAAKTGGSVPAEPAVYDILNRLG